MKDNLFELLLNLFEKTLTQLKEKKQTVVPSDVSKDAGEDLSVAKRVGVEVQIFKEASDAATRVFTREEQLKLTKASYQFLMQLESMGLLSSKSLEIIINRLFFSESRFVSLQETKWTIRNTLEQHLNAEQLAFLELILYCQEDGVALH